MTNPDNVGGLLPCPFCGGAAERIDFGPGSGDNEGGSCIACTKCQASGPVEFGYKENFVSNWNRRELCRAAPAGGDSPVAEIGELNGTKLIVGRDEDALARLPKGTKLYTRPQDSAPAGGDYPNEADGLALELVSVTEERDFLRRRVAELSAPAGSGEVEGFIRDLEKADSLLAKSKKLSPEILLGRVFIKHRAALLRKLQQGAAIPPHDAEEYRNIVFNPDERTSAIIRQAQAAGWNKCRAWLIAASQGQEGGHARD